MPKISVLMSVYNETESQIIEAINSLMAQSYSDFEIIIVDDAPENAELKDFLHNLNNSKLKVIINEKNIGLALSMNRAAEEAEGIYFARMDADDINLPCRFEKEIAVLESGKYDFVFTNYEFINEQGETMPERTGGSVYSDKEIIPRLLEANIIHHPTVMFTREIFEKTGGYRNYPCSQDYDLWLRMVEAHCYFHMIEEVLLKYRIRENSVSAKKRMQQKLTLDYARNCFVMRITTGNDPYSYEGYLKYVEDNMGQDNAVFERNREKLQKAKTCKAKGNLFGYIYYRTKVFFADGIYRKSYMQKMKNRRIFRRYVKRINHRRLA